MKTYTDLNQSKKLAEILPLESADMHYNNVSIKGINYVDEHRAELMEYNIAIKVLSKYTINPLFEVIPCWSLTALIEIIRKPTAFDLLIDGRGYRCHCRDKQDGKFYGTDDYCDNPIDACVEMIIKLNEQKLL